LLWDEGVRTGPDSRWGSGTYGCLWSGNELGIDAPAGLAHSMGAAEDYISLRKPYMNKGFDKETLDLTLDSLKDFTAARLPEKKLLELDAQDEFPVEIIRELCGPEWGIQLLFIPEELKGWGAGAFDIYRICESWRAWTWAWQPEFCHFLGSDPIIFGGTMIRETMDDPHTARKDFLWPMAPQNRKRAATLQPSARSRSRIAGRKVTGTNNGQ